MLNATDHVLYLASALGVFPIVGIFGNTLVCAAILTEKRLQNITNYFLCSLAAADLLVSIFVMPLAMLVEVHQGYWPFSTGVCNLYCTMDVLSCSASIIHMAVISFDRYWGISRPFRIRRNTPFEVTVRIVGVWVTTIVLAVPITVLGANDSKNILSFGTCAIQNRSFQLFGSFSAFLVPCVIMILTYALTVRLLRQQALFCNEKSAGRHSGDGLPLRRCISQKRGGVKSPKPKIKLDQSHSTRASPTHKLIDSDSRIASPVKSEGILLTDLTFTEPNNFSDAEGLSVPSPGSDPVSTALLALPAAVLPLNARSSSKNSPHSVRHGLRRCMNILQLSKRSPTQQQMVATEQKASKVLGVVFACFLICWFPFFSTNLALAISPALGRYVPRAVVVTFLWLGYISSTINPIIYTIFNRQFRSSFVKILQCGGVRKRREESVSFRQSTVIVNSYAGPASHV